MKTKNEKTDNKIAFLAFYGYISSGSVVILNKKHYTYVGCAVVDNGVFDKKMYHVFIDTKHNKNVILNENATVHVVTGILYK